VTVAKLWPPREIQQEFDWNSTLEPSVQRRSTLKTEAA
jgi:hypothetical protein